jgi:hypothetical protein
MTFRTTAGRIANASVMGFGLSVLACSSDEGGGGGGSGGGGGDPTAGTSCVVPSQVVAIGDSYLNYPSHTLRADLAAAAGVAPMGEGAYRWYAMPGASLASGGAQPVLIPGQFEQAVMEDPSIKLVIMDGGGNDFILADSTVPGATDCKNQADAPTLPVCQNIVQMGIDEAIAGMARMVEVGVKDVLYFFYPHLPGPSSLGGMNPNVMLDYALPLVRETCDSAATRTNGQLTCHFVDMVPVFEGHPEFFGDDGVHPNMAGSAAMAQAIWAKMTADCIGQPTANACCSQ